MTPKPVQSMTVGELIAALSAHDHSLPVCIADGYGFHFYDRLANAAISTFKDDKGVVWLDIGIGGCDAKDDK